MNNYVQENLPNFAKAEAEAREKDIDPEATRRHLEAFAFRAFKSYRKTHDVRLIDTWNKAILMSKQRGR